jgi:hypothetical protein
VGLSHRLCSSFPFAMDNLNVFIIELPTAMLSINLP